MSKSGHIEGQRPEKVIEDGAALRCRPDPKRNGWGSGVGSVITERLYV